MRLRTVRLEPRKELFEFAVEFVLVELKIKSVVPLNEEALDQLVPVEKLPEVAPLQVCAEIGVIVTSSSTCRMIF